MRMDSGYNNKRNHYYMKHFPAIRDEKLNKIRIKEQL
jgi:hypothetical protein